MAVTVQNLLDLDSAQEFRLVAGEKGLSSLVEKTGIVDYEFVEGFPIDEEMAFEKNSFVISSLLFAKDDAQALLRGIKSLIRYGVSALGIKTVFYQELPESVKSLADKEGFAIFMFDKSYFEDIIGQFRQAIESDHLLGVEEERLQRLYGGELSLKEIQSLGIELHPALQKWVQAYYCERSEEYSDWEFSRILSCFAKNAARKQEVAAFHFKKGFLFLVSGETQEKKRFYLQFSDALHWAGLAENDFVIGESGSHPTATELHLAIREAVCAQRGAALREMPFLPLVDLGILQILLWPNESGVRKSYSHRYLEAISGLEQERNAEFWNTAVFYVKTGGSIPETAKQLFVHDNTVRYRMARLRERLNPGVSDYDFFQNLSAAIWIKLAEEKGYL